MKRYLLENKAFLIPYSIFLILVFPLLMIIPKGDIHLAINSINCNLSDHFFKALTVLGDGSVPFILALIVAVFSIRKGLIVLLAGSIAGIIAQFFKRIVFPDIVRPAKYFEGIAKLHYVEGVDLHHSFSFPSGHAATAFAVCFSLACITSNRVLKFILFIFALSIAFSRVYLSQHFLNDIYAGSLIGVLSALIFVKLIDGSQKKWLNNSFKQLCFKN